MAWKNKLFRARDIFVLLAGFVILQLLSYVLVNAFMFHPVRGGYSESYPGFVDIGTNGCRIAAVVLGPDHGKAAVIYCHGNAEDATAALERFANLVSAGYTVASADYPGYGLSAGCPDEAGCYRVTHRLYDWLVGERGFAADEIFVVGYSIGTGPAVELASSCPVAGLWLEAPYLSAPRIVTRIRLLAVDSFPNWSRIGKVGCPVLVMHGTEDGVVPFSQGRALFEQAKEPKAFVPVFGAGHTDFVGGYGERRYENLMRDFISIGGKRHTRSDSRSDKGEQ